MLSATTLRKQVLAGIRNTLPAGTKNVPVKLLAQFLDATEQHIRNQMSEGIFPIPTISPDDRRIFVTVTALAEYFVGLILDENRPKVGQPVKALAMAKKMAKRGKKLLQLKEI